MNYHFSVEDLNKLSKILEETPRFAEETYREKNVMRGLRDQYGTGVITGLTDISDVIAKKKVDGVMQPAPGELY